MDARTLEWLQILARALIWGGGVVLVLSVIGAILRVLLERDR